MRHLFLHLFFLSFVGISVCTLQKRAPDQQLKVKVLLRQVSAQRLKFNQLTDTQDHSPIPYAQITNHMIFLSSLSKTLRYYISSNTAKYLEVAASPHSIEFIHASKYIEKFSQILLHSYSTLSKNVLVSQGFVVPAESSDFVQFKTKIAPVWSQYTAKIDSIHLEWKVFELRFNTVLTRGYLEKFTPQLLKYTEQILEIEHRTLDKDARWFYDIWRELSDDTNVLVSPVIGGSTDVLGYRGLVTMNVDEVLQKLNGIGREMKWFENAWKVDRKGMKVEIEAHAEAWSKLIVV